MVHLVLVCKYRKPLLFVVGETIKGIMREIAREYDFKIIEIEADWQCGSIDKNCCLKRLN